MALRDRRIILRAALAAVLISALGLSACGRKGALEPPPKANVTGDQTDGSQPPATSGKPTHRFFLDFLI